MSAKKRKLVEELHASARRNFPRRRVVVRGYDDLWQADVVEMRPYTRLNKGHNYIFTVIDALRATDKGKEFYNVEVRKFTEKHGVNHYSTYSVMKASIVERFNRTLKNSM
ncbi:uncharacterized protein [Polyergus mexicanus]|uniref:uncharacterized protein n=1 Tax=Polyergus mexicanus TaxID=615972 RepID=UPI0038B5DCE4